jgi:hypothetical protein
MLQVALLLIVSFKTTFSIQNSFQSGFNAFRKSNVGDEVGGHAKGQSGRRPDVYI